VQAALPGSHPAGAALSAQNQIAFLDTLAAEVIARGWTACITTPPGRPVRLFVQNPRDPAMFAYIAAAADGTSGEWWYWFGWAERIAPATIPATAAEAIASSLRRPADSS
jgi:nuclease-like protein